MDACCRRDLQQYRLAPGSPHIVTRQRHTLVLRFHCAWPILPSLHLIVLAEASPSNEEILRADLDLSAVSKIREEFPVLEWRRLGLKLPVDFHLEVTRVGA